MSEEMIIKTEYSDIMQKSYIDYEMCIRDRHRAPRLLHLTWSPYWFWYARHIHNR